MRKSRTIWIICAWGVCLWSVMAAGGTAARAGDKIPVTTASREALNVFLEGQMLVDNLRLTDGHAFFEKAVEKDPKFALAYLYCAQTAPTAKEFFAHLSKAADLASGASEGERLWIMGFRSGVYADLAAQQVTYRALVEAFPKDERALTLMGISHFGQLEYAEAARYLEKAIEVAPDFAPAYNQLGYAYRFLERYADAEKTFKKYTELIPNDPNPRDSYAEFLLKIGRFDDAVMQYRKALALNATFANSRVGISACYLYQGKYEEAREELKKAYELSRNDGERRAALFAMAVVSADQGKPDRALMEIDKQYALAERIKDAAAMAGDLTFAGNVLLETGRYDEARQRFDQSVRLIKRSSLAPEVKENAALLHHYNLARVAILKRDFAAAALETDEFRMGAEAKKNPNQIRLVHELEGMAALEQEQYDSALAALQQASLQNPYNLYRLALAYQGKGMMKEAREMSAKAAKFHVLPLPNYAFIRQKAERLLGMLGKV